MTNNKNVTNIYQIVNLRELSGEYRLYEIIGLEADAIDYQKNKQYLISRLSRELRHPIEVIKRQQISYLVTKNEHSVLERMPAEFSALQNKTLYLRNTDEVFPLDFTSMDPTDRAICKRFLQFSVQGNIFNDPRVWQPATGKPFFSKKPICKRGVDIFPGFAIRVVDLKNDGWGICVDATRKYLTKNQLPTYLTKHEFDMKYKGKRVVVKLGNDWYEVKLTQWHSLNVSQHKYPNPKGNGNITLIEDLRQRSPKPHPSLLANLPTDASVVFYHLSNGEERSVPAGLCFRVLGTEDGVDGDLHQNSILSPDIRLDEIYEIRNRLINNLSFGKTPIQLAKELRTIPKKKFQFPDVVAGENELITLEDANFDPKQFAKLRRDQILNGEKSGFLKPVQPILGPQYFFFPRSVYDTKKDDFISRLIREVNMMYPWHEYKPQVDFFEDRYSERSNYIHLGREIISEIGNKITTDIPSYAVVMIPSISKGKRQHDKLAALIIRELKGLNVSATIIHSDIVNQSYYEFCDNDGGTSYRISHSMRGKLNGYIRNVALTKILLNNRKYPFALAAPLNADITIGVDVKNNLAGFIYIDKYAKNIRPQFVKTTHKEKLPSRVLTKQLTDILTLESKNSNIRNIVLYRDGRVFETELRGIKSALKKLKEQNILLHDASISVVEIPKNSLMSYRMFGGDLNKKKRQNYLNPDIGSYDILNDEIGYVCTTGKEFIRKGTPKPLMVKLISGNMNFEKILQDVFFLSTLAFTKLDDCSRLPFPIKFLDILLKSLVSEYDKERLEYLDYEEDESSELSYIEELNLN